MDAARKMAPGVRFLCLTPVSPLDRNSELAGTIRLYAEAIRRLARSNSASFVDLTQIATAADNRKDPIHLNELGYKAVAVAITDNLKFGNTDWLDDPQTEALRQVILRKNEWWFHRSRPANMAYVFGFRKHEQGQNAGEIPQFDSLILEEERRIAQLRSLEAVSMQEPPPKLESQFAEFAPQPQPDFTVSEDLEITLWAQNPDLNKPIHMNFDPQGRLWVASSEAYPMIEVGQSAPDKIVVLEDSDGDGKADTSTVFAEGLLIPTGIVPGDGGVYVAQSTDLLFLKDTDGDGKADLKRRVLSGFGTEDTHHNLHTLMWGPDGRLYMNQSVYTRTNAETPHGVVRLKAGGGFRYDTGTMRMEIFFRGLWNSWGHQFDAFGQSFLSDGAGFAGLAYGFPGATFNPTPGARHQLDLISPGNWPKFASLEIIEGASYPPEWQGSLITCDYRANRVTRFSLSEQGTGFVTTQEPDLVRTSAATFRPIDVKQGPDGALYIADWSNPIINHGEVDFRDPRRDRWHGRIWRVTWKGAERRQRQDLTKLETVDLLDLLKSDDRYRREQARRVLVQRRDETRAALPQWLAEQASDRYRLEGLWLCQSLELGAEQLLEQLLSSEDPHVRAAATRVLGCWADPQSQPAPLLSFEQSATKQAFADRVNDEHPRVRLEAVRGLAKVGTAESGELALAVLRHPMDRFLQHATALTVNDLAEPLMAALEANRFSGDAEQLEFVLSAIDPALATSFLAQRLAKNPISRDGSGPWIRIDWHGGRHRRTRLASAAGLEWRVQR
jgi:glucose/arabinose dehydrogenase